MAYKVKTREVRKDTEPVPPSPDPRHLSFMGQPIIEDCLKEIKMLKRMLRK